MKCVHKGVNLHYVREEGMAGYGWVWLGKICLKMFPF